MPEARAVRKVVVVVGHARTDGLGHELTRVVVGEVERLGHSHRVHDLLSDGFDPVLRLAPDEPYPTRGTDEDDQLVARYRDDVGWADAYVIVHPVWWFAPPAILKGWVDRVLIHDVAIRQPESGSPTGLLGGRRALVVQTFGAPLVADRVVMRNLALQFWKRAVFLPVGIRAVQRVGLYSVADRSAAELRSEMGRLRRAVAKLCG